MTEFSGHVSPGGISVPLAFFIQNAYDLDREIPGNKRNFAMWDETNFVYQPEFDEKFLDLLNQETREFFEQWVIRNPENPEDRSRRTLFRALESILMVHMTEVNRQVVRNLRFESVSAFSEFLGSDYRKNKFFWFKAINRDQEGRYFRAPRVPLDGQPVLRTILDLYIAPHLMSTQAWGETGIRFYLHFQPFLQEYDSEDSGIETE